MCHQTNLSKCDSYLAHKVPYSLAQTCLFNLIPPPLPSHFMCWLNPTLESSLNFPCFHVFTAGTYVLCLGKPGKVSAERKLRVETCRMSRSVPDQHVVSTILDPTESVIQWETDGHTIAILCDNRWIRSMYKWQ